MNVDNPFSSNIDNYQDDPLRIYLKLMSKLRNIVREADIELEEYKNKR